MSNYRTSFVITLVLVSLTAAPATRAADPSPQLVKALSYKPRQPDVVYEKVDADQMENCTIEETVREDGKGFWITGAGGQPLRWFADTDKDNQLDRWSYYNGGVEVYREFDTDANGKADEYRWLNTEGMRRGVDKDEDGEIDRWTMISAEEVTFEVVRASSGRDVQRFTRLLISPTEIEELGLGKEKESLLKQRVSDAEKQFESWVAGQNIVRANSQWTNFGADKPGVVPAGTDGSKKDIAVYENTVALLRNDGEPRQLLVGTMIRVDDTWRLVDLPKAISEGTVVSDGGVFFSASFAPRNEAAATSSVPTGISPAMERLVGELQSVDEKLSAGSGDTAQLQAQRADVIEKLVAASTSKEEQSTWIRQFADTVSAATQTGDYPTGVKRLQDFRRKLASVNASDDDAAYVVFRTLTADYNQKMLQPKAKYEQLQEQYLKNLGQFVRQFPRSEDSAEAMITIGLSAEFSGDAREAKSWYQKASRGFGDTLAGKKATGALRRLELKGKPFPLQGKRIQGGDFDSSAYVGGPVIYHGWASWCEACKAEMRVLKELQAKYAKSKLRIVGLNFDNDPAQGLAFLKQPDNSFPWVHLYEPNGLDSNVAVSNGILSLPSNIVVDGRGRVVATGVHHSELDEVIADLVK